MQWEECRWKASHVSCLFPLAPVLFLMPQQRKLPQRGSFLLVWKLTGAKGETPLCLSESVTYMPWDWYPTCRSLCQCTCEKGKKYCKRKENENLSREFPATNVGVSKHELNFIILSVGRTVIMQSFSHFRWNNS